MGLCLSLNVFFLDEKHGCQLLSTVCRYVSRHLSRLLLNLLSRPFCLPRSACVGLHVQAQSH